MTSITSPGACAEAGFDYFDGARALAMFGSEQSFRRILQMALDSLSTDIEKMEELLEGGDLKEANHLLHGIKGFAPIFCCEALSAQIADLERSSKADPIEQVRQVYLDLMPALRQWRGEIGRHLAGSRSASRR